MSKPVDLKTLTPHVRNANKGTERGSIQIEESLKDYGAGRSIVVDKNGVVIAGNHVLEAAAGAGLKGRVIETDGTELIVVKRKDLDLEKDKRAVELAIADNRTSQVGLEWDADVLRAELAEGVDVSKFFRKDELKELLEAEEKDEKAGGKVVEDVMVKLVYTSDQYKEFENLSRALVVAWGLGDSASVVLEAMRRATKETA